jgi:glucokinase
VTTMDAPAAVDGSGTPKAGRREEATAIGVDVGASRLKCALIDRAGAVLSSAVLPTPEGDTGTQVAERIAGEIAGFREGVRGAGAEPAGIGIVVPYFVEGPDWVQRWTTNLPVLEGLPLRPILAERLGGEMRTGNDVSAAVIAEHLFGRGRGVDRLLLIAIGTGISIGVIVHGELLQYSWGTAGDTGHLVVDTEGLQRCTCGGLGCLETVSSGWGLRAEAIRAARDAHEGILSTRLEKGQHISTADVASAARQGDAAAIRAFERGAFFLGAALASYLQLFSPQLILLSGGVMESSDLLLHGIRQSLQRVASPSRLSMLEGVEVSAFPQMGAAIGSASLILFPDLYLRNPSPMEAQPTS